MLINIKKKIFSEPLDKNYTNLKYDNEGLWSITHYKEADYITNQLLKYCDTDKSILDATAGCGGNFISLSKHFKNVTAIELNKSRFEYLNNNIKHFKHNNITLINDDCLNIINNDQYDFDIYFFDPPWGGPNYKKKDNIDLFLSNINIIEVIKKIKKNKMVILKVPYNYNIKCLKKYFNVIETYSLENIIILFIKI